MIVINSINSIKHSITNNNSALRRLLFMAVSYYMTTCHSAKRINIMLNACYNV